MKKALLAAALASCLGGAALAARLPGDERRPAPVMNWRGASWLERDARDQEQRPDEVIRTMGLRDGDVVADLGCGSGYFTRRLARAVAPRGLVYGVDIQPEMLALLKRGVELEGLGNVVPVLAEPDDPKLQAASIDWFLLVDVYHELQQPQAVLARMRAALKPRGRVALVEYRLEGSTALHILPAHRMSPRQVLAEWEPAGFRLAARHEFLPAQHLFIFEVNPGR
jgi:predicted methyltransferase